MNVKHIALVCSSEEKSDKFYQHLLGLKKTGTKTVPSELSKQIFNRDAEYRLINYVNDDVHFEIFIDHQKTVEERVEHVCLAVDDMEAFLSRCRATGAPITQFPKGDGSFITFIKDDDGNPFEIKS